MTNNTPTLDLAIAFALTDVIEVWQKQMMNEYAGSKLRDVIYNDIRSLEAIRKAFNKGTLTHAQLIEKIFNLDSAPRDDIIFIMDKAGLLNVITENGVRFLEKEVPLDDQSFRELILKRVIELECCDMDNFETMLHMAPWRELSDIRLLSTYEEMIKALCLAKGLCS